MKKTCVKCNIEKPIGEFYKDKKYKGGYHNQCKRCVNEYYSGWQRKRLSGVSPEQYEAMFKDQRGLCAICGIHQDFVERAFSADHNHKTGAIRALLCGRCNMGLGFFKDNPDRLRKAAEYLESYSILSENTDREAEIIAENEPLTSGEYECIFGV